MPKGVDIIVNLYYIAPTELVRVFGNKLTTFGSLTIYWQETEPEEGRNRMKERSSSTEEPLSDWKNQACEITATIRQVINDVAKPYVVCDPQDGDVIPLGQTVTFELSLWNSQTIKPQPHMVVRLGEIAQFDKGWRAMKAEPIVPGKGGNHA